MGTVSVPHRSGVRQARRGHVRPIDQLLLEAGVLASVVYLAADVTASLRYPGYQVAHQAISELSATGAPTAGLWGVFMAFFAVFMLAFAIGVVRTSSGAPGLRTTGVMLLAFTLSGAAWSLFPMHQRGAAMTWQDQGHILMGLYSVLMLSAIMGVGAFTLGARFQLFSVVAALVVLLTGAWSFAFAERLAAANPTPWLGLIERASVHGFMAWNAVFALALAGRNRRLARRG